MLLCPPAGIFADNLFLRYAYDQSVKHVNWLDSSMKLQSFHWKMYVESVAAMSHAVPPSRVFSPQEI